MFQSAKDHLCVAFDVNNLEAAHRLAVLLRDSVGIAKVGMELFTAEGPAVVKMLKKLGYRVFLDLKYHDIPNTVAGAVRAACAHSVDFLTVHAAGTSAMIEAANRATKQLAEEVHPVILAVTMLTSIDEQQMSEEIGITGPMADAVVRLANVAHKAGAGGIIASPHEAARLRATFPRPFLIVCPGIRLHGASADDQRRVGTPAATIRDGADVIVVGRAIVQAAEPEKAARTVLQEVEDAISRRR